ncbi:hypothetical protein Ac2012v2_006157 [Leucoagaricus gongylophorus]
MSLSALTRIRKRAQSTLGEPNNEESRRKRPRLSSLSTSGLRRSILGDSFANTPSDSVRRSSSFTYGDEAERGIHLPRAISSTAIFSLPTSPSRASSPMVLSDRGSAFIDQGGLALMRSVSVSSMRSTTPPINPTFPDTSAKYHLRNTKITVDYSGPTEVTSSSAAVGSVAPHLLSCSSANVLFFCRGNRVHFRNIGTGSGAEDIGQLCKLQEDRGDLRVIECAGSDMPHIVALGTTKGFVQIWDVKAKKMAMSWSTKGVSVMRWNSAVLTVGGLKGTIRHYDTRVEPKSKMKDLAPKLTRHQARITSLAWNISGKILASGDESGTVYCWEQGKKVPLDVGEFVQRRKKMQHSSAVSAVAWCPWQPKILASTELKGILRLWNVEASSPMANELVPGILDLGASITGLHFSPHCKEFVTTHGALVTDVPSLEGLSRPKFSMANSVAVHSFPSLRHINAIPVLNKAIRDCVLNAQGTKMILEVPDENKLGICDVWSKRKELRRHSSFLDSALR